MSNEVKGKTKFYAKFYAIELKFTAHHIYIFYRYWMHQFQVKIMWKDITKESLNPRQE